MKTAQMLRYFILLTFLINCCCFAQVPQFKFNQISTLQGLSQSEVNCIYQDHKGFIWIGTLDGLNKFDGYEMTVYKKNSSTPNSISSNYIESLFEDRQGNLWIGTIDGLNRYNENGFCSFKGENYSKYLSNSAIYSITQLKNGSLLLGTNHGVVVIPANELKENNPKVTTCFDFEVNHIFQDQDGMVWVATWNGVYKMAFGKNNQPRIQASMLSNAVYAISQDTHKNIWMGTEKGVDILSYNQLNASVPTFTHIDVPNSVQSIIRLNTGKMVVGSRGGGVFFFEDDPQKFTVYKTDKTDETALTNNAVKCLYEDKTGNLWVGTLGGGCNKADLYQKRFSNYNIALSNSAQAQSNFIRCFHEDADGLLWIGTLDGGLYTYNKANRQYRQFPMYEIKQKKRDDRIGKAIYGENVFAIADYNGAIWVATNGGINVIHKDKGTVSHHMMDMENPDSLANNSVFSMTKGDDGSLWVGTWGGLHQYMPPDGTHASGYFVRYTKTGQGSTRISDNIVRYVYNDPLSTDIWVGTLNGGLNRVMNGPDNRIRIISYQADDTNPAALSSNSVNMVLRTKAGDLWIATNDGLNKLVPGKGRTHDSFLKYKEADGLFGNHVQSILEDKRGNLWLGTTKGLSKLNPVTSQFTNFNTYDGMLCSEFSEHAAYKNSMGKMFFGGVNGFTVFDPDSIVLNPYVPQVQFTNLLVYNQVIPVGKMPDGRTILNKTLAETKEIELSYQDKVVTVAFAALHFTSPQKNRYAYKLDGVYDDWIFCDANNRRATFTNLSGGTYTLKVIGSNNDGIWQKIPTTLIIRIKPPFWKTWPAYLLYLAFIGLSVRLYVNDVRVKERLKAEVGLKSLEKKQVEELNQVRMQFFTNISHEFRTPLTLIISPLEHILASWKLGNSLLKRKLVMMHHHANYLLNLINELMEFRKSEEGSLHLQACKTELVSFVQDIFLDFEELAHNKNITFEFYTTEKELEVWIDKNRMLKILINLIANAIKFTPEGGQIFLIMGKGDREVVHKYADRYKIGLLGSSSPEVAWIKVADTGIGISQHSLSNIFDRYYQVGSSDSERHLGSGIGLALVKNLVLMHKGELIVSSERGNGTEFIICLPLGDNHLSDAEKTVQDSVYLHKENTAAIKQAYGFQMAIELPDDAVKESAGEEAPVVLIVEDNEDMRRYIKSNLALNYRILEAVNGTDGYHLAKEHMPDLVISDVIMPGMNGIQLCKQLKKEVLTAHIPVILLTALASVSHQIVGLETGADDYMAKPFNSNLLEVRVFNLIQSRKKLRERFSKETDIRAKDFTFNVRDQEFLDKAIRIVKQNLSDPQLSVEYLSDELAMSRMQLFRKIKALTDQTPIEFINTIRLKEAVLLFAEDKYSISEVAYKVGFTAPSYFSTCFKNQFGLTPKAYLVKHKVE